MPCLAYPFGIPPLPSHSLSQTPFSFRLAIRQPFCRPPLVSATSAHFPNPTPPPPAPLSLSLFHLCTDSLMPEVCGRYSYGYGTPSDPITPLHFNKCPSFPTVTIVLAVPPLYLLLIHSTIQAFQGLEQILLSIGLP